MIDRENDLFGKVVKTWKWSVCRANYYVPDCIDHKFFYCREHSREGEDLLPYNYCGQELYVCRICGTVYEIIPKSERKWADPLRIWPVLYQQPYYWKYIKNTGLLMYYFVNDCGVITKHPFLDKHCRGDRTDSLDLIARFFTSMMQEFFENVCLFHKKLNKTNISQKDDYLIISLGKYPGKFPKDEFCVYCEQPDSLSLEISHSWDENIFGFTLDVNEEDFECYEGYRLAKFTYLGDEDNYLPDTVHKLNKNSAEKEQKTHNESLKTIQQIVKNPFGLNGIFLFEHKELKRLKIDTDF